MGREQAMPGHPEEMGQHWGLGLNWVTVPWASEVSQVSTEGELKLGTHRGGGRAEDEGSEEVRKPWPGPQWLEHHPNTPDFRSIPG